MVSMESGSTVFAQRQLRDDLAPLWYVLACIVPAVAAVVVPLSMTFGNSSGDLLRYDDPAYVESIRVAGRALREHVTVVGWSLTAVVALGTVLGALIFARSRTSSVARWRLASWIGLGLLLVMAVVFTGLTPAMIYVPPAGGGVIWGP